MHRRLGILGVLVVALLFIASCGTSSSSATSSKKLVYFIFTGFAYPYFAPMAQGVQAAAKYYPGMNIKIVSANNSAPTEISQIKEAIAAGAKGIILNPVEESVTSAAQEAMNKGIPVITIDRDVSSPSARIAFIGDNDYTLGKEQTAYAIQYLESHHVPTPYHVLIFEGTLGASTAEDRLKGAEEYLSPLESQGKVQVIGVEPGNFATDTAQSLMTEELAKTTNIQLVICGNDAMALGVITALESHGIKPGVQTLVVGADAQPQSLDAIKAGTQLDTVTHSPYLEAFWAVEAMWNYLEYHIKPPASKFPNGDVLIPMQLVDASNVNTFGAWGTPSTIPPLPYGKSSAHPATS